MSSYQLARIGEVANHAFDFIVIGGGASGCVMASRLSEIPQVSVALLEAGKPHFGDPLIFNPSGWLQQVGQPDYDWDFRTVPQKRAVNSVDTPGGIPNASFFWARGKGLGGSTGINFLLWTRPQKEEMDALEELGNPGWNWDRFFKASKRSETFFTSPRSNDDRYLDLVNPASVGHSGHVNVSFARTVSGAEFPFQKSLESFGIDINPDSMGGNVTGTFKSISDINPKTGLRSTAAASYLYPALGRPNLKVLTEAYVNRLITKKAGKAGVVATGVEFVYNGTVYTVNAKREVILNAGTIKSPQLLELSGIGDRKVLKPLGIPVLLDLPAVGTNLQDHILMGALTFLMKPSANIVTSDTLQQPSMQAKLQALYGSGGGPISLVSTGLTFLPLQSITKCAGDMIKAQEARLKKIGSKLAPGLKELWTQQIKMIKQRVPYSEIVLFPFNLAPDSSGNAFIGVLPSISHPFSRGTIHIGSTDPSIQPVIDPNYFSEDIDLDILLETTKFVRNVTHAKPWQDVSQVELQPGPSVNTDAQLRSYIQGNLSTTWHSCGTCSMLPKNKGGVVGPNLKVYGTKNIRVADLSILPLITAVHTQATTYGIAEQAASIIKAEYGF